MRTQVKKLGCAALTCNCRAREAESQSFLTERPTKEGGAAEMAYLACRVQSLAWWCLAIIPVLGRQRQVDPWNL